MKASEIVVGFLYEVNAVGTKSSEIWTVKRIKENAKGNYDVYCSGSNTPYERVFAPEQLVKVHTKMAKSIKSETIETIGKVFGHDMNIENITYMPFHERRGRKTGGSK